MKTTTWTVLAALLCGAAAGVTALAPVGGRDALAAQAQTAQPSAEHGAEHSAAQSAAPPAAAPATAASQGNTAAKADLAEHDDAEPQAPEPDERDGRKSPVRAIANAITELDVARAHELIQKTTSASAALAYERARLAVYVGDCDSAEAILGTLPETPETARLLDLARDCARATAGSVVIEDKERGVWIRVQDAGDAALAPLIAEVAAKARTTMHEDLGVLLPTPVRIDLVRDLFSLAGVSGLPLQAAETTGTVAVARWGRVTMLSPRAARLGYPWQDTLAHEITHLALTRGSRDFAPLWLQEGIAKREEGRWRPARPFDDKRDPYRIARDALVAGESVGVNKIGPSIAMLPTARAANISYAEVQSFMDFWIKTHGRGAFALLLADMKGLATRDPDEAMESVTGFPLEYWISLWQKHLLSLPPAGPENESAGDESGTVVQSVRLGDLLTKQAHAEASAYYFDRALAKDSRTPAVRFRASAAALKRGDAAGAAERLGELPTLSGLHGGWLGLHGRMFLERQETERALAELSLAVGVDPYGEEAACEGRSERTRPLDRSGPELLPANPVRRKLCEEARTLPRD